MASIKQLLSLGAIAGAFAGPVPAAAPAGSAMPPPPMPPGLRADLAVPPPMATPVQTPAARLAALAETYYEAQARFDPLSATFTGDNRFDDLLPMTIVPAVRARQFAMLHEVRDELMRIDRGQLAGTDLTTFDCLLYETNTQIAFEPFKDHLLPLNHMDSVPVVVANFGSGDGSQPIATLAQYRAYLKRVAALPQWLAAASANLRAGVKEGVVLPKALVVALLPQIQALARATPEDSAYSAPLRKFPAGFSKFERASLATQYHETLRTAVLPALRKFAAFLEQDYLPAARASAGWSGLPNGANWYRTWVTAQTTSSLSPEEIHRVGLAEMTRIRAELAKVGAVLGYKGEPAGLARWLDAQPAYHPFKTEAEVLQGYRDLYARITPALPSLFLNLPRAPLEIRPEPELSRATASDHYTLAAADGSRPGVFWAVITDPARYGSTSMASLFLHEGVPGHHFQLSRQQELPVPKFRKYGLNNAYIEGWALYAESLGKEIGLYNDPNAYAGHLLLDMKRAARLVVDTGLHAQGWSREQTIAFLMEQVGDSEPAARNATERYMAWPGQALGYKIGALKIVELRQRAASALGPKFDLAKFHEAVLAEGALPLALLETRINAWIAEQAK